MKISNFENLQIKFVLGRSLFLGGGISLMLNYGDKDAYLAIILGFLLGIPLIYLYSHVSFSNIKIYLSQNNIINKLTKGILLLFYLFMVFFLTIIFAIFIYSFYLPFTKTIISCTPFLFLAIYLSTKGSKGIVSVTKVLFFINILLIIFKYSMLAPYLDFNNFLPIYTIGFKKLFLTALIFAIFTTSPYFLVIDEKTSFKNNLTCYAASSLTIMVMLIYLIGVFGSSLAKTFSYPEFSILRQINVFNFIQNIESFLAINWLFDIFIALSLASLKIKEICHYKKNIWTYSIFFIIVLIVDHYVIGNYKVAITVYQASFYLLLILILLSFLFLLIKKDLVKTKST